MLESGLVRKIGAGIKVLSDGELTRPIHVKAQRFSRQAEKKIKLAGGVAEII
jgi:large subunit ribosomal protein L15